MSIERTAMHGTIEVAQAQPESGRLAVRGIANSFRIMHSGRVFHPRAFERQMQATGGKVDLPLLAMHGMTFADTFPNIGKVGTISIEPQRGLVFDGWIGAGTQLMDETRTLVKGGALAGISVGAVVDSNARRLVNRDDADIDPLIAQQMDAQGKRRAHVFFEAELVEISLVDVPDDREARLAAGAYPNTGEGMAAELFTIRLFMSQIKAALDALKCGEPSTELLAAMKSMVAEFWAEGESRLIESIASAVADGRGEYAEQLLADDLAEVGCSHGADADAQPVPGAAQHSAVNRQTLLERLRKL